ncbi:rod shape-determining protein [Xylocopilactobacillus apis]|uniref:Uncharacterized protein n=1 Tax=Xylocopilactobacillus apis TaxID=2932183 RepID=A0AAU9CQJ0_9LACO|nr:rod shape-determining protein [Xylocopilactobacillus apis]BDR56204.1 hypothetical protein KIMC2_07660 [Xylocopilactobacillus apis]
MFNFGVKYLSVDLGQVNTTIKYDQTDNLVKEPTIVAFDVIKKDYISFGINAEQLVGRFPTSKLIVRPFKNGKIVNYNAMLYFVKSLLMKFGPLDRLNVLISIPNFPNFRTKERFKHELMAMGVRNVTVEDKIITNTVYLRKKEKLSVSHYLLIDIGSNLTSFANFSDQKLKVRLFRQGINSFNQLVKKEFIEKFGVILSNNTVEYLKSNFFMNSSDYDGNRNLKIKGIESKTGLPIYLNISNKIIEQITNKTMDRFSKEIKKFIKILPESIQNHIIRQGIILTGDSSLLNNLSLAVKEKTGLTVLIPPNPADSAAIGGWDKLIELSHG